MPSAPIPPETHQCLEAPSLTLGGQRRIRGPPDLMFVAPAFATPPGRVQDFLRHPHQVQHAAHHCKNLSAANRMHGGGPVWQ